MTKENRWIIILAALFTVGIITGCLYCAFIKDSAELYEFLQNFIQTIKSGTDKHTVFKKSFISGIKITGIFFVCAMMRYGFIPVCVTVIIKSFAVGFTLSALFKYFGTNGIFLMLSQLPSNIILFLTMIFFGAVCSNLSISRRGIGAELTLTTIIAIGGVILSSFASGYIDTYILGNIAVRLY